ncbi:MAG: SDR family NAD(P)-dependent oxidoreductase [Paracoccus sp. (in: a-proteobacteria)]
MIGPSWRRRRMHCAEGFAVQTLPFDVTDHAAARAAVDGPEGDRGPIDILINNAGMQHRARRWIYRRRACRAVPAPAANQYRQRLGRRRPARAT